MSIKISKSDIGWGFIGPLFSLGVNIILMPFTLAYLSSDALGLWYVFLSIGNLVVLFDFGFSPTLARNIAYCIAGAKTLNRVDVVHDKQDYSPNYNLLKRVRTACKVIYLIIGTIAFLLMISVGSLYINMITKVKIDYYKSAWIIYSFAVFINLFFGYFTSYLKGIGAISEQHKANIIAKISQILISLILLYWGFGILAVSLGYLSSGIVYRLVSHYYIMHYSDFERQIQSSREPVQLTELKALFFIIWHNAWRDGLVALANYMTSYATTLICSTFLTLSETGIYSLAIQLVQVIAKVSTALYSTYQPRLQELYLINNKKESKECMAMALFTFYLMFTVGMAALIFIGIPILKIIKPSATINITVLLWLGFYTFLNQNQQLFSSYISNTNRLPYIKAYVFWGLGSVGLSFAVLYFFGVGIWGIIISQMLTLCAYNAWKWPSLVLDYFEVNLIEFLRNGYIRLKSQIKIRG